MESEPRLYYRHGSGKGKGKGSISFTTANSKPTHLVDLPTHYVEGSVVLSADGRFLAYIAGNELHIFDIARGVGYATVPPRGKIERVYWRPDNKWIGVQLTIFDPMKGDYGELHSYTIDVESGAIHRLKNVACGLDGLTFSPDSAKAAFVVSSTEIRVATIEELARITWPHFPASQESGGFAVKGWPKQPVWSPRGDLILFHAKPDETKDHERTLWIADLASKQTRQIASQRYIAQRGIDWSSEETDVLGLGRMCQAATWSPCGTHLAFKVHPAGQAIDLEPRVPTKRTLPAVQGFGFEIVPAPPPRILAICRYAVDTGKTETITNPMSMPSYDQLIYWSPDGSSLAFTAHAAADGPLTIWIVGADGSGLKQSDIADVNEIIGWR